MVFRQVDPEEGVFFKGFVQCSAGGGWVPEMEAHVLDKGAISPTSLVLI